MYKLILESLKRHLEENIEDFKYHKSNNYNKGVLHALQRVLEEITALEGTYIGKVK